MGKECRTCVFNTKNDSCKMLHERIKNCWAWADEEEYKSRKADIDAYKLKMSGLDLKKDTPQEKLERHFTELYNKGLTDMEIAKRLHIKSSISVNRYRKELGLESNFNKKSIMLSKEFMPLYERGLNDTEIASRLGLHSTTVRKYRVDLGLETQYERKKSLREQAN